MKPPVVSQIGGSNSSFILHRSLNLVSTTRPSQTENLSQTPLHMPIVQINSAFAFGSCECWARRKLGRGMDAEPAGRTVETNLLLSLPPVARGQLTSIVAFSLCAKERLFAEGKATRGGFDTPPSPRWMDPRQGSVSCGIERPRTKENRPCPICSLSC